MTDIWKKFDIAAGEQEWTWLQDESAELATGLRYAVMHGDVTPQSAQRHAEQLFGPTRPGIANRVRLAVLYLCAEKQGEAG